VRILPKIVTPQTQESSALTFDFGPEFRAILFADVVGYSKLMEADSVATYKRFRSIRVKVIDPLIVSKRGRVVKNTGDGFICTFEVPADAVSCANELHLSVQDAQKDLDNELKLLFRVGLHWGQLIRDKDDVFGHVVNVASRLQDKAPPGGTVISRDILRASNLSPNMKTTDLGRLRLKNLADPVESVLVGELSNLKSGASPETDWHKTLPSIALLPFEVLSPTPGIEVIGKGFVDDIITSLSNLREILTVANGSTIGLTKTASTMPDIIERLGVQYLFSGRIRNHGKNWRLSVELIEAYSGELVWAERYDFFADEVFDLQDEITLRIVRQLAAHLQTKQVQKALRKPPQSLTAYDYFLRALDLIYRLTPENFELSKTLLNNAIREDSSYASPFALSALWHLFRLAEGWSDDPKTDADAVLADAKRAIERDEANALAHAILGQAQGIVEHDLNAAKASVDLARSISPNSAWAWTFSSGPYGFSGDTKTAIAHAERGLRLSPLDRHVFFMQGLLAQNHYLHGNHAEAITWARRSLAAKPRFGNAARVPIASLSALGQRDEASKIALHHNRMAPGFHLSAYAKRCPFTPEDAKIYVDRLNRAGVNY